MTSDDATLALGQGECQHLSSPEDPVPTYQYACTECGNQLEAVQSFSDPALTECPACQGKLRKVFNSVGIVFKGSGFYRNDSREAKVGADKPNGAAAEGKPSADKAATSDSSSSSTKSDSNGSSSSSTGSASSGSGSGASGSGSSASGSGSSGSSSSGSGSSGSNSARGGAPKAGATSK